MSKQVVETTFLQQWPFGGGTTTNFFCSLLFLLPPQVLTIDGGHLSLHDATKVIRRTFMAGCFCLPWLWAVSTWVFWPELKRRRHPHLVVLLRRQFVGALVWFSALLAWILIYQLGGADLIGPSAFRKLDVTRFGLAL